MDQRRQQGLHQWRKWWDWYLWDPIAKAKGAFVTTTCSTANVEPLKSLGVDEVIDYRKQDVLKKLISSGTKYEHVFDNVGDQLDFYWKAHDYTTPEATYVVVGLDLSISSFRVVFARMLWPSFLGGGKRKHKLLLCFPKEEELMQIAEWMKNGEVKAVIDSRFGFEDAVKAFGRLKTHQAKGKIIVKVDAGTNG
jgi:NADPH:quinone reductase-like Zn-dependent oxidoreductase